MQIFISKNKQQLGPFDQETVQQKLATREIAESDLAWVQGMPNWQALSTILNGTATFASNDIQKRVPNVEILSFFGYGIRALKKPFDFSTRARRMEYWSLYVISTLIFLGFYAILFFVFDVQAKIAAVEKMNASHQVGTPNFGPLTAIQIIFLGIFAICYIYIFIASLALCFRRTHDLSKPGALALLSLVPIVNFFFGIYLAFFNSTPGANEYGPNPKNE